MVAAQIEIIQPFQYDSLAAEDAEWLRTAAAEINSRQHLTYTLICEMGILFLEAKQRYPGLFMAWRHYEFPALSDDTVENYMNVAKRMPDLSQRAAALITTSSLYKLCKPGTPQSVRDAVTDLLEGGQEVDAQTAHIYANAPGRVVERFKARNLPKSQAYALALEFGRRGLPETVKNLCLETDVSDAAVVRRLRQAHLDWERSRHWSNPHETWQVVAEDRCLNGIGWSVSLSEATERDWERFMVDRAVMKKADAGERYDWHRADGMIRVIDGVVMVAVSGPATALERRDGELCKVDIRVKRKD